ncbi:hypothetical protein Ahy_B08g091970 isoform A [Arachis hypogaea]|uniref:Protein FAR1-RELATED SEQUENCE n=1 Tax=Arachis hypogaea TaxID=3818 RepID=A0A444Y2W3_ARAHY|nr:hypothetical protein Ahy_B08g091970 isoform A [Arachis hypogaea]
MFARFRESLKRCVHVRICEINDTMQPHVYRKPTSNNFNCMCMRMESFGIPCVHIVAMCVRLDLGEIPESLVLRRLSRTTKMEMENENVDHPTTDQSVTYRTRLGAFSQLCKRLGKVACMTNNVLTTAADNGVKDPICVRTKGTGRCSQGGSSAVKTKRKCSTCGKLGHQRTQCPNRGTQHASTN